MAGPHSETALLKETLKRLLRARGIRYREVAAALGISTITVKRFFSTDRLTVGRMEEICGLLDISLSELLDNAREADQSRARALESEQEDALAADSNLALLRTLLISGWTPADIRDEYGVDEATLITYLIRLEKLRVIELMPGNRVRLLTVRDPDWRPGGPMRRVIDEAIRRDVFTMDFAAPDAPIGFQTAELSQSSVAQLNELIRHFMRTVRTLRDADRHLPRPLKEWNAVLIATRPVAWHWIRPDGSKVYPRSQSGRVPEPESAAAE